MRMGKLLIFSLFFWLESLWVIPTLVSGNQWLKME
jgi:hypothetical protein